MARHESLQDYFPFSYSQGDWAEFGTASDSHSKLLEISWAQLEKIIGLGFGP